MNPFQLTGFSFLGFYVLVGIIIIWGLRTWIRQIETADAKPQQNMTDPYLIATLRAGEKEALRVATVALLDRGMLVADGVKLKRKQTDAAELVKRPIEKAILKRYAHPGEGVEIFKDANARTACKGYAETLAEQGLIANGSTYARRFLPVAIALGLLIAVTWTKINIAFSQGRHNVGFLIILTIVFAIVTLYFWRKRRTALGDAMMADLQSLFSRLKGRTNALRAGGQTNEAALLAAVFGLSALPVASFPFMQKLYPAKSRDGGTGSSCSGGCGGGGCGG